MAKIHRIGWCFGFPLWAGKRYVELWICLHGLDRHTHPRQHVEVIPLAGFAEFFRLSPSGIQRSIEIRPWSWWRTRAFSIPAGWVHWFKGMAVFVNVSDRPASENFLTA